MVMNISTCVLSKVCKLIFPKILGPARCEANQILSTYILTQSCTHSAIVSRVKNTAICPRPLEIAYTKVFRRQKHEYGNEYFPLFAISIALISMIFIVEEFTPHVFGGTKQF